MEFPYIYMKDEIERKVTKNTLVYYRTSVNLWTLACATIRVRKSRIQLYIVCVEEDLEQLV